MLIKCPECGKEISDKSNVCINCGFPLNEITIIPSHFYDIQILNIVLIDNKTNPLRSETQKCKAIETLNAEECILREVLGYTKEESAIIASTKVKTVAKNITGLQASKIIAPFKAYNIPLNIYCDGNEINIQPEQIDEYSPEYAIKKEHYYDSPVINEEQRVSVYERDKLLDILENPKPSPQPRPANIPKCPTCGSTNIKKISNLNRGVSVATFGLFSKKINKSFKCMNCSYTW